MSVVSLTILILATACSDHSGTARITALEPLNEENEWMFRGHISEPVEFEDASGRHFWGTPYGCDPADDLVRVIFGFEPSGDGQPSLGNSIRHRCPLMPRRCLGPRAVVGAELPAERHGGSSMMGSSTGPGNWYSIPSLEERLDACLTNEGCPAEMRRLTPP